MITNQHKKMLQKLMEQEFWEGFEAFFADYMERNFIQSSIKRNSEFETIWQAAESEGGKRMLNDFKNQLENNAREV